MTNFKKVLIAIIVLGFSYSSYLWFFKIRTPSVKIVDDNGTKASFSVEVADSEEERRRGLMFRESLPLDEGMIFVFPKEEEHFFWMKDTLISLDIIFINSEGDIVGIVENASPEDKKLLDVGQNSLYVLEINAGLVKKYDINIKDKVKGLRLL